MTLGSKSLNLGSVETKISAPPMPKDLKEYCWHVFWHGVDFHNRSEESKIQKPEDFLAALEEDPNINMGQLAQFVAWYVDANEYMTQIIDFFHRYGVPNDPLVYCSLIIWARDLENDTLANVVIDQSTEQIFREVDHYSKPSFADDFTALGVTEPVAGRQDFAAFVADKVIQQVTTTGKTSFLDYLVSHAPLKSLTHLFNLINNHLDGKSFPKILLMNFYARAKEGVDQHDHDLMGAILNSPNMSFIYLDKAYEKYSTLVLDKIAEGDPPLITAKNGEQRLVIPI